MCWAQQNNALTYFVICGNEGHVFAFFYLD